jgi:hypothetical protein
MRNYALWGMIFSVVTLITLIALTVYIHEELHHYFRVCKKDRKNSVDAENMGPNLGSHKSSVSPLEKPLLSNK